MHLPNSKTLNISTLSQIFDNTTATYKFYWFVAVLDIVFNEQKESMLALDVASRMVAYALYPIKYFNLSFGKNDSMAQIVADVVDLTGISVDDKMKDKTDAIIKAVSDNKAVKMIVKQLLQYVPFLFQTPWIETKNKRGNKQKREMIVRSQKLENSCLYSLYGWDDSLTVVINPKWSEYLNTNYMILRDFAFWNLSLFLQSKNPNVPNISEKILRPERREKLTQQKKFWNKVIEIGGPVRCIYTDKELGLNDFALDHFLPWRFVAHDQIWNLIPADKIFNSSKSDRIPDIDYYLPKMADIQHNALRLYVPQSGKKESVLDEYYALGVSPRDLMLMTDDVFRNKFRNMFLPLSQMAINMGYKILRNEKD